LIDYQQDRRQLVQLEDNVHRTLRATLRRLEQLRENLEIQRRAGALAVRRVDEMLERLNEPPPVGQPRQLPPVFDLMTALSDLRNTQNNFMSVWLNYYASRMTLYRELGIMELDDRGIWIDRPLDEYRYQGCEDCPLPPDVPQQWIIDANQPEGEGPTQPQPAFGRPPLPTNPGPVLPLPSDGIPTQVPEWGSPAPIEARVPAPPRTYGAAINVRYVAQQPSMPAPVAPRLPISPVSATRQESPAADPPPPGWPALLRPPQLR
jgi:hypothetical protein